jgi:hypothetical protein
VCLNNPYLSKVGRTAVKTGHVGVEGMMEEELTAVGVVILMHFQGNLAEI